MPKGGYAPRFRKAEPHRPAANLFRLRIAALAGLGGVLAIAGWWHFQREHAPIPIAVLPLTNVSQNAADDYFADGLTSEIISDLSMIDGLEVRSQTSSFALKSQPRNVREAGRELNAEYLLEGSVALSGQQLRINVQLVRASDDVPIWSGKFDRKSLDVLSIQDEISRGIVNGLRLKLGRGRRRYETSVESYDLYLRARGLGARIFPGDPEVTAAFEKSIAKDPSLAPAWAGLAAALAWRTAVRPRGPGRDEELERMQEASEKAIELDPLLAEAQTALGTVYARNARWDAANRSFRRAIEIDANFSLAHESLARFYLWPLGKIDEAVREMGLAERNDPLSPQSHRELADVLLSAGRFDESERQCEHLPADSVWRNECLGRARLAQGRIEDAIPLLAANPTYNWGYLAYAYAKAGQRARAEKLMDEGPKLYPDKRGAFQFALVFAGFGDTDRTLERLERLAPVGAARIGYTLNSPEFVFLRGDPRTKALRKKVGLPE